MSDGAKEPVGWPEPLLDLLIAMAAAKRVTAVVLLFGMAATCAWVIKAPKYYQSSAVAVLMSRQKPSIDATVRTSLFESPPDASTAATTGALMLPAAPELYIELLRSDNVLTEIATRFRPRLALPPTATETDAVCLLRSMIEVLGSEEGMVTVSATGNDPAVAADLANAVLLVGEQASHQIERRLVDEQLDCLDAALVKAAERLGIDERRIGAFFSTHRLIDPKQESTENLRQIRETQMLRDRLQRDLDERLIGFRAHEVGVRRLTSKLDSANRRLATLERRRATASSDTEYGDLLVEYDRLQKQVQVQRDFVQTLRAQRSIYAARAEQAIGNLVTIKAAAVPASPAGPRRMRILVIGTFATAAAAFASAVLLRQWRTASKERSIMARVHKLKSNLRLRRSRRTAKSS